MELDAESLRTLKLRLWDHLSKIDGIFLNGPNPYDKQLSAPHIMSITFDGLRGEVMRNALEGQGVLVSTGSACSSHKQHVSSVLKAMGMDTQRADGTIRISLGFLNTIEEMDRAAECIISQYKLLRSFRRR